MRERLPSVPFQIHSISGIKQYTIRMQKVACWNPRWTGQRLKTLQSATNGYFVKTGQQNLRKVRLWLHMLCPRYGRPLPYTVPMITRLQETCHCRVIARRIPGSTGFNIFPSELNASGYLFKKIDSLLNNGHLLKGKNLLL